VKVALNSKDRIENVLQIYSIVMRHTLAAVLGGFDHGYKD
jgi:hypothetical protein